MKSIIYRIEFFLVLLVSFCSLSLSQTRYRDIIFSDANVTSDLQYGESKKVQGYVIPLTLDLYEPIGDLQTNRPLMLWIHGGSLLAGAKSEMRVICTNFARRGYVSASLNYRTGIADPKAYITVMEAWLRAVQDCKAAVRFFRANAATYRIDTTQIYVGGSSAGSMVAVHMAYWDQSEIPAGVNQTSWGDIEGTSGNPGHSSAVQGVLNYCGAIGDTTWIQAGNVPVGCFHGLQDVIVPPDHGVSTDFGIMLYGGVSINRVAARLGIYTKGAFFANMGHGVGDNTVLNDSLTSFSADFIYSLVKINTGVKRVTEQPPAKFFLSQNFPNPFNPATRIAFGIPEESNVRLSIYDIVGREVETLVHEDLSAGSYSMPFTANSLTGGVYFCRLVAAKKGDPNRPFIETKKLLLVK